MAETLQCCACADGQHCEGDQVAVCCTPRTYYDLWLDSGNFLKFVVLKNVIKRNWEERVT
jgi:hypothetical protein